MPKSLMLDVREREFRIFLAKCKCPPISGGHLQIVVPRNAQDNSFITIGVVLPTIECQIIQIHSRRSACAAPVHLEVNYETRTPSHRAGAKYGVVQRVLVTVEPYILVGNMPGAGAGILHLHVVPLVGAPVVQAAWRA